jgi:hypothetical protein
MWLLKSYENPLPNNYVFTQTTGIVHQFSASPIIDEVVKAVSNFRIANNLPRASLAETLEDVDRFNCAVRNNDERWCWNCPGTFESVRKNHRFITASCLTCGTPITQD